MHLNGLSVVISLRVFHDLHLDVVVLGGNCFSAGVYIGCPGRCDGEVSYLSSIRFRPMMRRCFLTSITSRV